MIEIKINGTLANFDGVFRNVNEAMEDFARAIVALRCLAEKKGILDANNFIREMSEAVCSGTLGETITDLDEVQVDE